MIRLTKRNDDKSVSIDAMEMALDRLAEYEDTGLDPWEVERYKMFVERMNKLTNCNDCGNNDCGYKPEWGDNIRFNCPLWNPKEDKNDCMV